ncbi:MAG TPA: TerC family protein [Gordonia sp. (in: high G+C Gram-positive bacteria)]|uniref:TerC family protein n=1 Tax=unclassified Gordonia (in: high G+C Gram-positive bacteria) TaxID=2657482 RepID=UPI000FA5499A|nr:MULTISPECIES: TerC family protein [unclassified Gordonia (in: high G+C Gram-positive bacteria)]RUP38526.1 MAG: TerC family protein [Gordonia sp. (in: high G+C Gram-positive bacteria)]HNP58593.1 TerC family protein [Gordonia sp. (in: high G+C Gram-positive bacteria)]HRC52247.1 TerC family protein [Gordonia sp. (in: high G+C Gram-positive bacteria)]
MDISLLTWVLTCAVILGLFVFDFFAHVRVPHEPTLRESGFWSTVYIAIAVVFGCFVWWRWGGTFAGEYFAGYVTEKALSVDNLFVFVVIMAKFAVPRVYQQKVLLLGIVMALVMRGVFIAAGAAAIARYSWVFYLFGVILILTAINMLRESDEPAKEGRIERFAKRHLRTSEDYDGDKLFTRVDGRRMATPLLLVLIVIGFTDLLFAFDSIPAIYGLTQEPYLVFAANAFALMGLRQLFFLIGGLLDKLVFLSYGLSFILAFIGVKLVLHALHENSLGFINGGEHVSVPEISTGLSLAVIGVTLVVTTVASLVHSSYRSRTR